MMNRSIKSLIGFTILATDGEIGKVQDFLIDASSRKMVFLVVDTGNFLLGKKMLISTRWINEINWGNSEVAVNVTVGSIKHSLEYDPSQPLFDEYVAVR